MIFSSLTFLFAFLPLTLLLYFAVPRRLKNAVLLAASLLFYAWGEGLYLALMLGSIGMNFGAGFLIDRHRGSALATRLLGLFAVLNVALLAAFKYTNFIVDNLNLALGTGLQVKPVHLPIGISFFTFQALSYLIDLHRGQAELQRRPFDLALYIAMFPQLIAGPIVRYHDVARQIAQRVFCTADFAYGVRRFVFGLAKKVLLANVLGQVADDVFALQPLDMSPGLAWVGVLCYAFQIYFDFSGYSDMAIGLGRMFGFKFLENFDHPYIACSIQEFWRRWHISLSSWFRDYLYIPLGGSRVAPWRVYLNLLTVFLLCGLWHGAAWNFVVWGLMHGAFLVLERLGGAQLLSRCPRALRHMYTLFVVLIGWVFFRSESLEGASAYLTVMFGGGGSAALPFTAFLNREVLLGLLLAIPASLPACKFLEGRVDSSSAWSSGLVAFGRLMFTSCLFGLTTLYLIAGTYNPFIYFRF